MDEVKVAYPSMYELMDDLRNMGEGNAIIDRFVPNTQEVPPAVLLIQFPILYDRRQTIHRDTLAAASAIYKGIQAFPYNLDNILTVRPELHGQEDGTVPATFQIIYMVCSFRPSMSDFISWFSLFRLVGNRRQRSLSLSNEGLGRPTSNPS